MEKKIYLYRHGETNWNILDRVMGQKEVSTYFTPNGIEQIKEISTELKNNGVEAIYCSDYQRTLETAKFANIGLNLPIFVSERIRGLNMGKYQGMYFDEYINQLDVKKSLENYNIPIGNGESINQLNDRILKFIKEICENTNYKKIAIISHSAAISNLKSYLTKDKYIGLCKCFLTYCDNKLKVDEFIPSSHSCIKLTNDLVLIRHAENIYDDNLDNDLLPLSKEGIQQAQEASQILRDNFDVIFCSPSKRAYETAYIISNGKPIIQDSRLIERGWGNEKKDGYETDFEAKERFLEFLLEIIEKFNKKRVVIVTHGSLIRLAQDVIECHCKDREKVENCTMIKYSLNKDKDTKILKFVNR